MGFRRIRIVILFFFSSVVIFSLEVNVYPEQITIFDKIFNGFLAAGPTFLLALYSIKKETKKEKNNIEKEKYRDHLNLKKEWYNKIVLEKILDTTNEYFDFIDLNINNLFKITEKIRIKRLHSLRKLNNLKIFDNNLYKDCAKLLRDSVDNINSSDDITIKKNKNLKLKTELIKTMYNFINKS